MAFKEDTNAPLILTIGAISGFLVIVAAIGLQAWFMNEVSNELADKYATSVNYQLTELRADEQKRINTYRWMDPKHQMAAIPIEQAMTLLIQNGGKLPTTRPAGAAK